MSNATLVKQDIHSMNYEAFLTVIDTQFLQHPIVTDNRYTAWFSQGEANMAQLKDLTVQFSVFSNLFLIAQLKHMLNADSLESMRAAKEILANEIGVVFNNQAQSNNSNPNADTVDPALVSTEGTVDGGTFCFRAAHFEWMLNFGSVLGLGFNDLGKRKHGTASTLFFCDELERVYGSNDFSIAAGASFAIENWAAAGFWQELEDGLTAIKNDRIPNLSTAFFSWHNRLEAQHAAHTQDELAEIFNQPSFDREKFLSGGREMLAALAVFWNGLEETRLQLAD